MDAFVQVTQQRVTGDVTLRCYKGSAHVVGRTSAFALYDERFVTFGEDDVYEQSDAAGFIRLYGLSQRVRALKDAEAAGLVPAPEVPADEAPIASGDAKFPPAPAEVAAESSDTPNAGGPGGASDVDADGGRGVSDQALADQAAAGV
jgi:hypothetical protein